MAGREEDTEREEKGWWTGMTTESIKLEEARSGFQGYVSEWKHNDVCLYETISPQGSQMKQ